MDNHIDKCKKCSAVQNQIETLLLVGASKAEIFRYLDKNATFKEIYNNDLYK